MKSALVALLLLGAQTALAQSLADVARAEEARRKAVKTPGKVITNDTLRPEPPSAASVPPAPATGRPEAPTASSTAGRPGGTQPADRAAATPGADGAAGAEPAMKDEAYWRKRIETERAALSRAQTFAEALQSRINALSTDFINRDDPQQRSAIAADRMKALEELERVRKEIETHQTTIATIQDEARKAGAPAGWVR